MLTQFSRSTQEIVQTKNIIRKFLNSPPNDLENLWRTYENEFDPTNKESLWLSAALNGRKNILELLLKTGINIEAMDRHDQTALHCAAQNGHTEVVALLLANSVNIEPVNGWGETPLHLAARDGHTEVAKLLFSESVNKEAVNKTKRTAFNIASEHGHTEVAKLLFSESANKEAVNKNPELDLDLANTKNHTEGADPVPKKFWILFFEQISNIVLALRALCTHLWERTIRFFSTAPDSQRSQGAQQLQEKLSSRSDTKTAIEQREAEEEPQNGPSQINNPQPSSATSNRFLPSLKLNF